MSNADINNITRDAVLKIFHEKGLKAADNKVRELLLQCEQWRDNVEQRGAIKGELSEIGLECHLLWWMQQVPFLTCCKSLCIKSKESNATAEVDILLLTPYRIYLFECKSFKGHKTLTKECYLKGKSSEKDVYEQSKYHLKILDEHLAACRTSFRTKVSPYKLALFELSSDDIEDTRTDKWKHTIPALTLDSFDKWMYKELTTPGQVQWDYNRTYDTLCRLDSKSVQMFKYHMQKINKRKGSK